jgi:hypothetical protein
MAQFLNTDGLREWIPRLISEAERELVIIVPYIKTSDLMYQKLIEANERGVESVIVYREEALPKNEKDKLLAISNLKLLHHPNIHAKCYLNQDSLIITSMNMYEYSEKNNREMGILFHPEWMKRNLTSYTSVYDDTVEEIRNIINGSHLEKPSSETSEEGFILEILKNDEERAEDLKQILKPIFVHRSFQIERQAKRYLLTCSNYSDKIDLTISKIAELNLKVDRQIRQSLYQDFREDYSKFLVPEFKVYWNGVSKNILLYMRRKEDEFSSIEEYYYEMKTGLEKFIGLLKSNF